MATSQDNGNGHVGHRLHMKRRFLKVGLGGFEAHNALELLLFYCVPRKDVNPLAHRLIDEFGSFDRVLEADYESLLEVEGVGESCATFLKLVLESYRYYEQEKTKPRFFGNSTKAAKEFARSLFVGESREICYLICFDSRLRKTNCVKLSEGTLNASPISVRRVIEIATINKASSVILTHNHPSGSIQPSAEDIALTKKLFSALEVIGVELNDHIIVAQRSCLSMADEGVLFNIKSESKGY